MTEPTVHWSFRVPAEQVDFVRRARGILRDAERVLAPWKSSHPEPRIAMAELAGHYETAAEIGLLYVRQAIEILEAATSKEEPQG